MDVLYFIKEEYAFIKDSMLSLSNEMIDLSTNANVLMSMLNRMNLVVRVADEIILPELAEVSQRKLEILAEAGNQTSTMGRLLESPLKSGRMGEARKKELFSKMVSHISIMEQVVLPLFREEISTLAREELGLVALDFKGDICTEGNIAPIGTSNIAVVG